MKNKLAYFGFLGLLGLLGFIDGNTGFYGFFGFFSFFRYYNIIPDELFKANVQKAATPAFFVGTASSAATLVLSTIFKSRAGLLTGFALTFAVSVMVFMIILLTLESKEGVN